MRIEEAQIKYGFGNAILKEDLKPYFETNNKNTFNQMLSNMVKFGLIKRAENGIYFFPFKEDHFKQLKPSITDIIYLKYLNNYSGIRTGAFLAYKYKLTNQVSGYYEIITNNISKNTRSKFEYNGQVIVKASKFKINYDNLKYYEFLELINNIKYSDYSIDNTLKKLIEISKREKLNKDKLLKLTKYYSGYVNKGLREKLEVIINEVA